MDPFTILLLAILNFFLSFFSVIVGGGSLVMVPLLISLGIPAPGSVAIAKFYNMGTGGTSLFEFNKGGKVNWGIGLPLAGVAVVSSLIGAYTVLSINEFILKIIIAFVIMAVLIAIVLNKKIGIESRKLPSPNKTILGLILTFFIIFLATLAGGGGGIMITYVLLFIFGQTFLESMGTRKVVTVTGIFVSAVFFMISGAVIYEIGLPLLLTGALGGWAGSKYAMKKGDRWVRIFFIVVGFILALNILFQL
jgi:uncharacterized membrane protein YfcA